MSEIGSFEEKLRAARDGEEWAWAALYTEYAPKVLGYLRSRNAVDPEDLLSETFMQMVRDLGRFSGDEPAFRSWMFTIAHHRLLDDARYRSRRPQLVPEEEAANADTLGDVEEDAIQSLTEQEIQAVLGRLPDDQQAVLLLRLFAGMTAPQIAEVMGKTPGAVKALQHRGTETLRQILGDDSEASRVLSGSPVALQGGTR